MPATKPQNSLTESVFEYADGVSVDAPSGVMRRVKLIGFESVNGRSYPANVLKKAVNLYEGAKVNIDHPEGGSTTPRKVKDRFGVIKNARFIESEGVFGDCHYNPKHEAAEQIAWEAENNPKAIGFSHNVILRVGKRRGNKKSVVEEIIKVRSMDIVADPATTRGLFEHDEGGDPVELEQLQERNEVLESENKDLKSKIEKLEADHKETQTSLESLQADKQKRELSDSVDSALEAAGLTSDHVTDTFRNQLLATESEDARKSLIDDRAEFVKKLSGGKETLEHQKPRYQPRTENATEQMDSKAVARLLTR